MTDEARGDAPDETPVPPASTRWSEDAVQNDDALAPPFVPGRAATPAPPSDEEPAVEDVAEEPIEDERFPFEVPLEAEPPAGASGEAGPGDDLAEDDFPYERFDIEGSAEPEPEAESTGWTPADLAPEDSEPAARDTTPEPESVPVPDATPDVEPDRAVDGSAAGAAADDVAALLDRIAGLLRREGEAAVHREMESEDRLTALVAGLVAGYLSGRS